jgi:hypothetical protein
MLPEKVPGPRTGEAHLSKGRIEIIAHYKAAGRLLEEDDFSQVASTLGVDIAQIKEWDKSEVVNIRAMQLFQPRAFQSLAKHWDQVEAQMAKGKLPAFRLAAQICTVLPVGGISINQNTIIDARQSGQSDTLKEFARGFWERVQNSRPDLKLVVADYEVKDESDS